MAEQMGLAVHTGPVGVAAAVVAVVSPERAGIVICLAFIAWAVIASCLERPRRNRRVYNGSPWLHSFFNRSE
jgi:hypothetical protein